MKNDTNGPKVTVTPEGDYWHNREAHWRRHLNVAALAYAKLREMAPKAGPKRQEYEKEILVSMARDLADESWTEEQILLDRYKELKARIRKYEKFLVFSWMVTALGWFV